MATKKTKTKAPKIEVTDAMVETASKKETVRNLVRLADAYTRAGVHGPFKSELHLFAAMSIPNKGFRKGNVNEGTSFEVGEVRIGKRDGLIFQLTPVRELLRNGEPVEFIEIGWDDVVNHFEDIATRMDANLNEDSNVFVKMVEAQIQDAIARNAAMHEILNRGFKLAQADMKESAIEGKMETLEGYGTF